MNWRFVKYLLIFTLPLSAWIAFNSTGILTLSSVLLAFAVIPALEFILQPDATNITAAEEEMLLKDRIYDIMLYLNVLAHWVLLFYFLTTIDDPSLSTASRLGRTLSMGVLCGVTGINLAHELGHRSKKSEIWMALSLLLTSLYMHFYIEHNRGHHKNAATYDDPASARFGESVYAFWLRSGFGGYLGAWQLERKRLSAAGQNVFSLKNEMVRFTIIQTLFVALIFLSFGALVTLCFIAAALIGGVLLETVNYIEHYGLQRLQKKSGRYERVQPHHSWNSNHVVGRLFLFELSRHSDHHYMANRPYQILKSYDYAPQMPTGYPGMMLLALLPPLWFTIMNRRVESYSAHP